jgi:type III secretory pathway component EscT
MKTIAATVFTASYLSIGALFHWALLGSTFHVGSVASWGVLFGWPFVLSALFLLIGLLIGIVFGLVFLAIETVGLLRQVNRNQRIHKR